MQFDAYMMQHSPITFFFIVDVVNHNSLMSMKVTYKLIFTALDQHGIVFSLFTTLPFFTLALKTVTICNPKSH